MADDYSSLKLENQLCFPLYAAAKEVVKKYRPILEELDLTYTQYIAMMVLWEEKQISVKELGEKLFLDSGTLTPLLKSMETKGFVTRHRSEEDERVLIVGITDKGENLRKKALSVPVRMGGCIKLSKEEAVQLYSLLYKVIGSVEDK
ncbi:MAG: MarR family transcriptional regulator [Ruminococcaceae bacterium]|nr:MarR family transcriptional regulator [Oscillospiraceae bacterium]